MKKTGIYKFGYVSNNDTFLEELARLTGHSVSFEDINKDVDSLEPIYVNSFGYDKYQGNPVEEAKAKYLKFRTGFKTTSGDYIWGWFEKNNKGNWIGVSWGTESVFKNHVGENSKFHIGKLYFDNWDDGGRFLHEIEQKALPEPWDFGGDGKFRILKSYLENVFERLLHESIKDNRKLIYSKDGNRVLFNTNLLDKFSHEVYIVADVRESGRFWNPRYSKSQKERLEQCFTKLIPSPPSFFTNIDDIIFNTSWDVDKEYDAFNHIIEERRERFAERYKDSPTELLAKKLQDAIDFAVILAQRNYKFIVPMYRPQTNSIQLLMPIYLEGIYGTNPDFALVLTPDSENEMYIPETILSLDMCYQNARLIAKPDETWLNPQIIKD